MHFDIHILIYCQSISATKMIDMAVSKLLLIQGPLKIARKIVFIYGYT